MRSWSRRRERKAACGVGRPAFCFFGLFAGPIAPARWVGGCAGSPWWWCGSAASGRSTGRKARRLRERDDRRVCLCVEREAPAHRCRSLERVGCPCRAIALRLPHLIGIARETRIASDRMGARGESGLTDELPSGSSSWRISQARSASASPAAAAACRCSIGSRPRRCAGPRTTRRTQRTYARGSLPAQPAVGLRDATQGGASPCGEG